MKNVINKNNQKLQKSIFLLAALLLSNCTKSKFGPGTDPVTSALSSNNGTTNNNSGDGLNISKFSLTESKRSLHAGTRSLAQNNTDLSFIDNVSSATYSINTDGSLHLGLVDANGIQLAIDSSFAASSRYKSLTDFILVELSNGSESTSLVIHKNSRSVFITKDTGISDILLSSSEVISTLIFQGANRNVTQVSATKTDGSGVSIGLVYLNNSVYALRL